MTLPVDWTHYLVPIGVSTVIFFARNKGLRYLGVWWLVGLIHAIVDYHRGFCNARDDGRLAHYRNGGWCPHGYREKTGRVRLEGGRAALVAIPLTRDDSAAVLTHTHAFPAWSFPHCRLGSSQSRPGLTAPRSKITARV